MARDSTMQSVPDHFHLQRQVAWHAFGQDLAERFLKDTKYADLEV
jgi:hypothetical protein